MKLRQCFVSNSSSSSFIILIKREDPLYGVDGLALDLFQKQYQKLEEIPKRAVYLLEKELYRTHPIVLATVIKEMSHGELVGTNIKELESRISELIQYESEITELFYSESDKLYNKYSFRAHWPRKEKKNFSERDRRRWKRYRERVSRVMKEYLKNNRGTRFYKVVFNDHGFPEECMLEFDLLLSSKVPVIKISNH